MSRRLEFGRRALADLRALTARDRRMADRIGAAIITCSEQEQGDVRNLAGGADTYRLRVGDWRVLFTLDDEGRTMAISRVLNRRDAYR